MSPLVSVIVPLYNKVSYVGRSLDSIAAQTHPDFEVIVVDDGSTDGSDQIAADYPDKRFRVVSQVNAGPGAARNRGVREAKGRWVAFLDADDEWEPEYLAESLRFQSSCGEHITAVTSGYRIFPGGVSTENMWRKRGIPEGPFRVTSRMKPLQFVHAVAFMCPWSTMVRADVFRRWGGFYENRCLYAEDAFLWLKVLLNEHVGFQLQPLVRFHAEASDLSNNSLRRTPIEPFLTDPAPIRGACPPKLEPLLSKFLAIRAFKRACVLSYWGDWQGARSLQRDFASPGSWRLPYHVAALLAGTPLAAKAALYYRGVFQRKLAYPE